MDWAGILLGAVLGIALDRMVGQALEDRFRAFLHRRKYRRLNEEWKSSELTSGPLQVLQTGWDSSGCFDPGSLVVRMDGAFVPRDVAVQFRESHRQEWLDSGLTNGTQVGVRSMLIRRDSDEPDASQLGHSHSIRVEAHRHDYFDFLSTHVLRLKGSEAERAALNELGGETGHARPAAGFPTPLSVGLSVLADNGTKLVLSRRARDLASGGWWSAGALFNGVGEGCAPRDFSASPVDGALTSSPEIVAARGLHEELGLLRGDVDIGALRIHTLAWASDLLDFKFLGYFVSPMATGELMARHQAAPDRSEGDELLTFDVATKAQCLALIQALRSDPDDWSPEAVVCTLRTLLVLRRIAPDDLRRGRGTR